MNSTKKTSLYSSLCRELAQCLIDKDLEGYQTVYEIARKSDPSGFSETNKERFESDVLKILVDNIKGND